MITKDFVDYLSGQAGIGRKELVEKDLYLQGLLIELAKSEHFSKSFVFKGGTCLSKAYLGYYRFSEDLDFTWVNQKLFENKSGKRTREILSKEIDTLIGLFVQISAKLGLEFMAQKNNKRFIELGGNNKFATFKFWYKSVELDVEQFIKIQINFVEKLFYPPQKAKLRPLAEGHDKRELLFLFPEQASLLTLVPEMLVYDLREICAEKARAILTRRGVKARDLVDLYMMSKKGVNLKALRSVVMEKICFMLKYQKYRQNIDAKKEELEKAFTLGDEQRLLIKELDIGFVSFSGNTLDYLKGILAELIRKLKEGMV